LAPRRGSLFRRELAESKGVEGIQEHFIMEATISDARVVKNETRL
jgi:hypothetical protein